MIHFPCPWYDYCEPLLPEADLSFLEDQNFLAINDFMGDNVTSLSDWYLNYKDKLFQVSGGRIFVGEPTSFLRNLHPFLSGSHFLDFSRPFSDMGVSIIPPIYVDGRPLTAQFLPDVFRIINDGEPLVWGAADFSDPGIADEPILPGIYIFSHQEVPGSLDLNFFKGNQLVNYYMPPSFVLHNEMPFIFSLLDHIVRVGVDEYSHKGYFGVDNFKFVRLFNRDSLGHHIDVGGVDAQGLGVILMPHEVHSEDSGRAFIMKVA